MALKRWIRIVEVVGSDELVKDTMRRSCTEKYPSGYQFGKDGIVTARTVAYIDAGYDPDITQLADELRSQLQAANPGAF